ncbi:oligosaccharide flippase family protein [Aliarcobacter skirrowii]|uniref:oligosaccharide flippase family protein n=1 Tax=Aliarcobacter skirrowii TaxID=28200 RepID=UPI00082BFA3A|nr:oligosaccharide flippase family protein [Aliarcobacter skirrowii]
MIAKAKQLSKSKFVKDVGKTTSAKIITVLIGFALKIIIVRLLTKEDFGLIAVLTSLSSYFTMMADFSTHGITQRNIVKEKDNYKEHYHVYVSTKLITLSLSVFLFAVTAYILGYFEHTIIMTIIIINMIFGVLSALPKVLMESFEQFGLYSKIMIYVAVINLVLQSSLVYIYQSVESLFVALFFTALSSMYLYYKFVGIDFKVIYNFQSVEWVKIKDLLKDSFPLFAGSFFYLLYYRIDTIMIEKMVGLEAAAEYSLGFMMADQVLEILWVQFIIVFYPKMIKMYQESKELLNRRLNQVSLILLVVYSALFGISYGVGEYMFGLVFGEQYIYSGYIFTWIIVGMFFTALFSLYYRVLVIANKQTVYLYLMMFGALANFLLNLYLIDIYGSFGAVLTTLFVNITIALISIFLATKELRIAKND